MRRRRRSANPVVVGLALIGVIIVGAFLAVTQDVPFVNEPFTVKAAFRESNGIKKGSPVRIAGVEVGEVTKVEPTSPGAQTVTLTLAIREQGRPVHRDATAKIRPRIFLEGNFFVELTPGRAGTQELAEDDVLPLEQTANPVQFDQVLRILQTDVRENVRTTFAELARTEAAGGAKAFNRSLDFQPAAYKFSSIVADALLGEKPGDLRKLIRTQGIVSEALDKDPQALMGLIVDFGRTASALADRQAELQDAVGELPRTLRAALPTLSALNAAFPSVRRFASDALPGVRSIGPAATATIPLVRQLRGLVGADELRGLSQDLRRATPGLARLSRASVPLLEQLRTFGSCIANTAVPFGNSQVEDEAFPAQGKVFQETPKSLVGLAGESRSFDANGQWFKVLGAGGLQTLALGDGMMGTTAEPMMGVNPPPQRERPPLERDAPCENQATPDLRTNVAPPPPTVETQPASPTAKARAAKAQTVAVDVLRDQLRAGGNRETTVRDRAASLPELLGSLKALERAGERRP